MPTSFVILAATRSVKFGAFSVSIFFARPASSRGGGEDKRWQKTGLAAVEDGLVMAGDGWCDARLINNYNLCLTIFGRLSFCH